MKMTILLVLLLPATFAYALQPTQPAAGGTTTSEALTAIVTAVQGLVQVRDSESDPWQRATVGMQVGQDAEFRTGPRSSVQFSIPPDHTITLDRLGTVKVLQAVNDGGVIRTQMGMKYGRARYEVEAGGQEHESSIASPSATLAVRGTDFVAFDQRPFPAQGVSLRGEVQFRDRKKRINFGAAAGGKAKVDVNNASAASFALGEAVVDPGIRLARTQDENRLVATLLSSGATVGFDFDKGIRIVRGGQPPRTDAELIPTLPGALNFVLRWTAAGTDLNLGVFTSNDRNPQGVAIYPLAGLNLTPSGGTIAFDHRGGPNGGIEICSWPAGAFEPGPYTAGSVHISGPDSPATLDIFLNGERLTFTGPNGSPTQTASYIAAPIDPEIASGQFAGTVIIPPEATAPVAASVPDRTLSFAPQARKSLAPPGLVNNQPIGPRPVEVKKQ